MRPEDARTIEAVRAVVMVAGSNFPAETNVEIRALGANTACITIPSYRLAMLLILAESAALVTIKEAEKP